MEKFSLAVSRFKRYKFDDCIILCDEILKSNPNDYVIIYESFWIILFLFWNEINFLYFLYFWNQFRKKSFFINKKLSKNP